MQGNFRPQIIIDDREDRRVSIKIGKYPADLLIQRLTCADYQLSDRVVIERKTDSDFQSSLIDGRLFSQASELRNRFESPIIAVIGKNFDRSLIKAVNGAIISLSIDFHLPVMFFDSEDKFVLFIYEVAKREQIEKNRVIRTNNNKKPKDIMKTIKFVVESLPGIGPKNAEELLKNFQTIERIATANENELTKIAGLGTKNAQKIRTVLSTKFELN